MAVVMLGGGPSITVTEALYDNRSAVPQRRERTNRDYFITPVRR
jgi:hypothetical protein